jgi:hypothetical protein
MPLEDCSRVRSPSVVNTSRNPDVPYPLHFSEGESKSLLTQFSGEPQIVNVLAISQLTESLSWDPGTPPAAVNPHTAPVHPSTITISGTYCTVTSFRELVHAWCMSLITSVLSHPVILTNPCFTSPFYRRTSSNIHNFQKTVYGDHSEPSSYGFTVNESSLIHF